MLSGMRTLLVTLHSKFIHASLALPCLAAYCGKDCGEILIREFTVHEPREQVLALLLAEQPDVIAFSTYVWNRRETLDLVDALAVVCPDLRIVLGGPEISFEGPQLFFQHPGLDALVRGEGEIPLRGLLAAWQHGQQPQRVPRLMWRMAKGVEEGPEAPALANLDDIPSPFSGGLVDLTRGLVYYETSRGCPYNCAFCMSSLDNRVRSYSLERIRADLALLMTHEVPTIKLVDRTFNYDATRARAIFAYILAHNRTSRFHFEIGAHLFDDETLQLLQKVPAGMFQFEIGVQSTLPETLSAISRSASLETLENNVRILRQADNIHLHLDLIAGLPGEDYDHFLNSLDRVAALRPHHLQVEAVKLLPGAPLRHQAREWGMCFDPNPPYRVLSTPQISFVELERLRGISRLIDLTYNTGRLPGFLDGLRQAYGAISQALVELDAFWRSQDLYRLPLSQRQLFEHLHSFVKQTVHEPNRSRLTELLARDYALSERVTASNAPAFFNQNLSPAEQLRLQERIRAAKQNHIGLGIKLQFFAAVFHRLPPEESRRVLLFVYRTRSGEGLSVEATTL
jgi:anaerobic magnesium-protoporphyrin IX monomethyl ester cyclase